MAEVRGRRSALSAAGNETAAPIKAAQGEDPCTKMSAQPQKSWEEVLREADNGIESHGRRLSYVTRIGPGNSIVADFIPILWDYDQLSFPRVGHQGQKAVINQERAEAAFEFLRHRASTQKAGASVDDFDLAAYLAEDRASMSIVWSAWAIMLAKQEDLAEHEHLKGTDRQLAFTEVPGEPELGTWLLAVPRDSTRRQEAEEFVRFATGKHQIEYATCYGNPPPLWSVLQALASAQGIKCDDGQEQYRSAKYQQLFCAQLRALCKARPRPRTACWKKVEDTLGDYLAKFIASDSNSSEAVSYLNSQIAPLLGPDCTNGGHVVSQRPR